MIMFTQKKTFFVAVLMALFIALEFGTAKVEAAQAANHSFHFSASD
jgi:hypothetical protein